MTMAERFKAARASSGLSAQELAEKVGTDRFYISKIERGLKVPSLDFLYHAAIAMGMRPFDMHPKLTKSKSPIPD